MRRWMVLALGGLLVLSGCASHLTYDKEIWNDIPFEKRRPPTLTEPIIISQEGPQLDRKYYDILGNVRVQVQNLTILENHCKDAINLLRIESENAGADALLNVTCAKSDYGAKAYGLAIAFKNRDQGLRALKDIGAVVK